MQPVNVFNKVSEYSNDFDLSYLKNIIINLLSTVWIYSFNMVNFFFNKYIHLLYKLNRKSEIVNPINNLVYLEKYNILFKDNSNIPFNFNIFLYKYLPESTNLEMRDYPFDSINFILNGIYTEFFFEKKPKLIYGNSSSKKFEYQPMSKVDIKAPYIQFRKADKCSKIVTDKNCWMLSISFGNTNNWGYWYTVDYGDNVEKIIEFKDSNKYNIDNEKSKSNQMKLELNSDDSDNEKTTSIKI